jgi:hypothetical protein
MDWRRVGKKTGLREGRSLILLGKEGTLACGWLSNGWLAEDDLVEYKLTAVR